MVGMLDSQGGWSLPGGSRVLAPGTSRAVSGFWFLVSSFGFRFSVEGLRLRIFIVGFRSEGLEA